MRRLSILCVLFIALTAGGAAASNTDGVWANMTFAPQTAIGGKAWRRTAPPKHKTLPRGPKAAERVLFGDRTVEAHADVSRAGIANSFPSIDPVSGTARTLTVYLGSRNRAKTLIAGLYRNKHGRPGALIAWGSRSLRKAHGWTRVRLRPHAVRSGSVYWIALMGKGGRLALRVRAGGCRSVVSSHRTLAKLPASWRRGHGSANCPVSAFVRGKLLAPKAGSGTGAPSGGSTGSGVGVTSSGACASATPNTPDGPDPWGGCFPGPSTTGIPTGTQLTPYTGSCNVTTNNLVIDAKTIDCNPLTITASNVVISRSLVNGEVTIDSYPSAYSFTITDSEVIADSTPTGVNNGATGIGKSNFVAIRDNVHGGIRSIWCEFSCTEKDNWLHGQLTDPTGAAHESATRMGENSIITHNSMVCDAQNVPPDAGCSADLTGYGDFEVIESDTISNNLFMTTQGGTCAYGGSSPGKPYSNGVHNIVFQNNIFQRGPGNQGAGPLGHCGNWFGISDFDPKAPGNQWINNRWDDGTAMPSNG